MRSLVSLAALAIVLGAIKLAAPLLVPLLLAATLTIAFQPVARQIARQGWPPYLGALATCLSVLSVLAGACALAFEAGDNLADQMPRYQLGVAALQRDAAAWLDERGMVDAGHALLRWQPASYLASQVQGWALEVSGMVQVLFLVVLITVFMQLEASSYRTKLARVLGGAEPFRHTSDALADVQRYLAVKVAMGLVGGAISGVWCWGLGVSNPLLWGLLAFLLSFVPIIGSLIAAALPVLVALVEEGVGTAIAVAAGFAMVNLVVHNLVEPRIMGRAVDLSPLVVLLSMLVWGWLLGPVGALLSVPLTLALRAALLRIGDLRWVADLLAPEPPAEDEAEPAELPHRASA